MANASLEDCQLFAQSEILQRDLFIAAKQQEDHPKKREDCVQHEAESVSASSLKINRFRNRWNSGEAQVKLRDFQHYFNGFRAHAGLGGRLPEAAAIGTGSPLSFASYRWQKHCRGLYQTPVAA